GCWRKRGVSGHKQEAELTVAPQVVQYVARPGVVVTGDALYCQRALCAQIVAAGGDYLFFVKGNQPSLQEAITVLFAAPPPGERFATATQRHQYSGRQEVRHLRASAALNRYLDWPGMGQVGQVTRTWTVRGTMHTEVRSFVTSLGVTVGAARLLAL